MTLVAPSRLSQRRAGEPCCGGRHRCPDEPKRGPLASLVGTSGPGSTKPSDGVGVNRKPRPNMHGTLVDVEVIKDAVRLACRAPSLHNSQPWRFEVDGEVLHLFHGYQPNHAFHRPFGTGSDHQLRGAARPPPGCHGGSRLEGPCRQVPHSSKSRPSGVCRFHANEVGRTRRTAAAPMQS